MFNHYVQHDKQPPHAGCKSHLLRLTSSKKTVIEASNRRVETHCGESGHIQRAPYITSPSPDNTLAPVFATIPIERSETYESSNLLTIQTTQFQEFSYKSRRQHCSYSRRTLQDFVLLTPHWALLYHLAYTSINVSEFLFQPVNMSVDPLFHTLIPGS